MKLHSLRGGLGKARKNKKLTQEDLAKLMKVNLKTVRNWEQGIVNPDFETVMKLSELLECDLDYLTGRIDETTHDIHSVHEFTGLSEKAIRKMSPPGLHPNASSPTVMALNHFIEADGFQDFILAYQTFLAATDRLKTATIPESVPYPVDEDGAYVIDGSTRLPKGAQTVIGRDTVTLRIDEYARWCIQEASKALMRLCESDYQESNEMCKKNSMQKKRTDSKKNRRHE